MIKKISISGILLFCSAVAFTQSNTPTLQPVLQLKGVFVNETPVTIDVNLLARLNDILSKDFEVPYDVFHAKVKGIGKYKIVPQPDKITNVITSVHPIADTISMQQIRKEEFLTNLPFSYRAVKDITFSIAVDVQHIAPKRVNTLPLHLLGTSYGGMDTVRFSALWSEKVDNTKKKKSGKADAVEVQIADENYVLSSGERYVERGKNRFTLEGDVWSIRKISKDTVLVLARKENCCDPLIVTEYAVSNGTVTVLSKAELYGLKKYLTENDQFKLYTKRNMGRYHYLKVNNEPVKFLHTSFCTCQHQHPYPSTAGVKPIGNVAGLLRANATIYQFVSSGKEGLYGLLEANTSHPYKVYVGGWLE